MAKKRAKFKAKALAPAAQPQKLHQRNLSAAAAIIKQFEGLKLKAYKDSGGIWTIGYGSIKGVKPGMVITKAQAETMFDSDFNEHMVPVQRAVTVSVNDNEFGALVSLCYNIGVGAFNRSSVLKNLNAGKPKQVVADCFMLWVNVNGKPVQGLVNRRAQEKKLFLTPEVELKIART